LDIIGGAGHDGALIALKEMKLCAVSNVIARILIDDLKYCIVIQMWGRNFHSNANKHILQLNEHEENALQWVKLH
jgi:hypothetical protein